MSDFIKAIPVVPSATLNIPEPGSVYQGASSTNGTTVTSTGFLTSNVKAGDSIQVSQTGSIEPQEIHRIISVDSDTELTLSTPVLIPVLPYEFKVYRSNGGSLLEGNSGYSLLVQLSEGDSMKVIPVGQTEEVQITKEGSNSIIDVLSQIKVQRVTESDASNIIALDTD